MNLRQNVGYVIETVCKKTGLTEDELKKMSFEDLLYLHGKIVEKLNAEIEIDLKVNEIRKKER